jgi:hypothetical protein
MAGDRQLIALLVAATSGLLLDGTASRTSARSATADTRLWLPWIAGSDPAPSRLYPIPSLAPEYMSHEPPLSLYAGCTVTESLDNDGDGLADSAMVRSHDREGRPVRVDHDGGADGVIERTTYTSYNDIGQPISHRTIATANGAIDRCDGYWYEDGGLVRWQSDKGCDGVVDDARVHSYDDGGFPVRSEDWELGAEGRAQIRRVDARRFLRDGKLSTYESDLDVDGQFDMRYTYRWRGDLLLQQDWDMGANGSIDATSWFEHDQRGRLSVWRYDDDGDKEVDMEERSTYDDATGLISRSVLVVRSRDTLVPVGTTDYDYDPNGRLVMRHHKHEGSFRYTFVNECP